MNILVCIKQVPASNKVEVDPVTGVMKRDGAASKMNPYDLFALETAFRVREKLGGKVTVMTMGPNQAAGVIREAYAMGADDGYVLSDRKFAGADVLATSYTIAQGIKKVGNFDMIFCGKQTTDGDTAQVGPEISERLDIPSIANVFEIEDVEEGSITVKMDMGDSIQTAKIKCPCLICVDKDIYTPRLPSYKRAKATAEQDVNILSFQDFDDKDEKHYGLSGSPTQVKRVFPPAGRADAERLTGSSQELTARLYDKLKELKFI